MLGCMLNSEYIYSVPNVNQLVFPYNYTNHLKVIVAAVELFLMDNVLVHFHLSAYMVVIWSSCFVLD